MARPSKTATVDFSVPAVLSVGLLERAVCPPGLPFVLLKDAENKGLRLRVTEAGGRHWQFEARVKGKLFTRALGVWPAVPIGDAQAEAHRLRSMTGKGIDPRVVEQNERDEEEARIAAERAEREAQEAAQAAKVEADRLAGVTIGEAWSVYLEERRTVWGERHYADHLKMSKAGGEVARRGVKPAADGTKPRTMPGPVFELLALPLRDLTPAKVEAWATEQAKSRPTYARLCWRCLKVFLNWCAEHPTYAPLLVTANPAKTKKAREALGKPGTKDDALQREQLPAWFAAVRQIQNPIIAACLQVSLLTGARPGEVLTLRWEDVNSQWKGLTIRDKVEGVRVIPLTPYVAHLLAGLPRRNEWVFPSFRALSSDPATIKRREAKHARKGQTAPAGDMVQASASGHLADPSAAHRCACAAAGLDGLTLHGLRRSFASVTEWLEMPAGVVAQIQGHKPSATAEKHYKRRPLDLLRLYHERIEAWILEQAGVQFDAQAEPGKLRIVAA
jgi:integrase